MEISVIRIGNSKGIRLPKAVLQQFSIDDKLEMEVHEEEIVLRPLKKNPREGWREAFEYMHEGGEDTDLLGEFEETEEIEWEWDQ
ncbi:MAG: AbrB/MazE/SpoVT family DNA-binding domain-containing protein [Spirochaetes bacterium]|jgi:antitoxin MazE|nr:AbrB/MazE/SpoVT family DNA-binding domain-containing protein [Spirochaetota bacterium]